MFEAKRPKGGSTPRAFAEGWVHRFDRTERWLHWVQAALVLVLIATGAVLYIGPLSAAIGRRQLMRDIHVISGLVLPAPFLLALAGRWSRGLRRDAARLGRWLPTDTRWVRTRGRSSTLRTGKFNAGQKLNALFVAGSLPVLLGTGAMLHWFEPFPDTWRTGATFVHDWTATVLSLVVLGHIGKAMAEPAALRAMVTGWVPAEWARRHRPAWHDEVTGERAPID